MDELAIVYENYLLLLLYILPVALFWLWRVYSRRKRSNRHAAILKKNQEAGLTEPASLHPLVDRDLCIACNACAKACPEGEVLAIIGDKVELINPTLCIGHGACADACPVDAITLVFGTARRGVDIPFVDKSFETNVPGLFIAGELGGMGLIRNAIEQGRQAMEFIEKKVLASKSNAPIDVLIVGAGPAGFAASLGAMKAKLNYHTIEQDSLGGTVFKFPRGKLVMTAPVDLPIVGKVKFKETTKEILLEFWRKVEKDTGVKINYGERMDAIEQSANGFTIKTSNNTYEAKTVLLSIGRRGTPRKLGVQGEELSKVVYCLIDPEQYRGKQVLVVGGGDSALEAATSIAEEPDTTVTISYRSEAFSRAKEKNRIKIEQASAQGKLTCLMKSNVKVIQSDKVVLAREGEMIELPNDAIIVSAGGILPTGMLKDAGITVDTKHGEV